MSDFIKSNRAFNFLIKSKNINLEIIQEGQNIDLRDNVYISSFLVPHRNEMSETVGYKVKSSKKSIIYLPDIDSWEEWDKDINDIVKNNDYLLIDGTFYAKDEIPNRDIQTIPHPSIAESLDKFSNLSKENRKKVFFTHLNHTNKILKESNAETISLLKKGYNIASDGETFYI